MNDETSGFAPVPPDESHGIFTENLDYSTTGQGSIWGKGYEMTLRLLELGAIRGGRWLNMAAGDGRYNDILLRNADSVVATDIDAGALDKLRHNTPADLKNKLSTSALNLNSGLPFKDGAFDGIFCTGILHLLSPDVLRRNRDEFLRILRPGGRLVLEFPSNIKRIGTDGKLITFGEKFYTVSQAKEFFKELLGEVGWTVEEDVVEDCANANPPFMFHSTIIHYLGFKSTGDEVQDKAIASTLGHINMILADEKMEKEKAVQKADSST